MPDTITELEALAKQLWTIHAEALGFQYQLNWYDLDAQDREAWIQVAEFVDKRGDTEVPDHK